MYEKNEIRLNLQQKKQENEDLIYELKMAKSEKAQLEEQQDLKELAL